MKKRHSLIKKSRGVCFALLSLLMVSCAQDGFDDETFGSSVRNTTLKSPELQESCFSTVTMADGSEKVKVTWGVVEGAGGYEVIVNNVDDPQNPVVVLDSIYDGCSALFPKAEDTKYSVSVKTMGNAKFNNKDAEEATLFAYSTMIAATVIPNGSDIAEFINANITSSEKEQAFELVAGGEYTLNDVANFKNNWFTLRGNKINHPVVKVGDKGSIWTGAGFKLKWIDFDCTEMATVTTSNIGLLCLDAASYDEPGIYENLKYDVLEYANGGANQKTLIIEEPIIMSECMVKNLPMSLFWANKSTTWALKDLRVTDCIVQLNNGTTDKALINFVDGKTGGYLTMTLRNNTFMNIADNNKAFTLRMANASNAVPAKLFGKAFEKSGKTTLENNTWVKCMSGKNFGDRMVSNGNMTFSMNGNIFYDTWRVNKAIGNCTKDIDQAKNTIYCYTNATDGTDKEKYCTEEDPDFVGPFLQELDLTKPNGGINLKARGEISSTIGDPRWRE